MNNQELIKIAIEHINQQGHVELNYILKNFDSGMDSNKAPGIAGKMQEMEEFVMMPLFEAEKVYVLRNPNYKLNENVKATNNSLQKVNNSTITLNTKTIPDFNKNQKLYFKATLILGLFSLIAISTSIYYTSKSFTGKQLDSTNTILKDNQKSIQSVEMHLKEIDSTLKAAAKDSFYQKK